MNWLDLLKKFLVQLGLALVLFFCGLFVFEWLMPGSVLPFFDFFFWSPLLLFAFAVVLLCSDQPSNRAWIGLACLVLPTMAFLIRWTAEDFDNRWMLGLAWVMLVIGLFVFSGFSSFSQS